MLNKLKDWATDVAATMFREDEKSAFRNLPKSTRLSILLQLSFIWSLIAAIYVFQFETMALGFASLMLAHILLIFAVYYTFKQFHRGIKNDQSLQTETKSAEYSPPKLLIFVFMVFIIFIFTRGLMVMDTNKNSYSIQYDGPATTTLERVQKFFLNKR
tara:strand:+ start:101 stop:574 length:474 start_codon:yes stop_codon:yes gene_type:complete